MLVDTITDEVERVIQDDEYDSAWALRKVNECLLMVATVCRIPGLQDSEVVSLAAEQVIAPVPDAFLHDMYFVSTPTYPKGLLIAPNKKELQAYYDASATGPVAVISRDGQELSFAPIPPDAEDVTVHFYKKPTTLSAGDSFPDYIPETLQKELFQNYALKEAYLQIEDGVDGGNPNTQKYSGLFSAAMSALTMFYPNAPKERAYVQRSRSEF
jgi:hypothetical protein